MCHATKARQRKKECTQFPDGNRVHPYSAEVLRAETLGVCELCLTCFQVDLALLRRDVPVVHEGLHFLSCTEVLGRCVFHNCVDSVTEHCRSHVAFHHRRRRCGVDHCLTCTRNVERSHDGSLPSRFYLPKIQSLVTNKTTDPNES